MCGRFVRTSPAEVIAEEFGAENPLGEIGPSYNIAPSHDIVIVLENGSRVLAQCRWGFVPSWAKEVSIGYKMINARAESLAEKPAFRNAFRNHRCLVVADGFYEWTKGRERTPVYIRLKSGKPFGMAGLYSYWSSPDGNEICTCNIITTEANEALARIHDRMPAIVSKENYDLWLDSGEHDAGKLQRVLTPYRSSEIEYHAVSKKVNSPSCNEPDNILPTEQSISSLL
jgi:putative SOS response-associated peptidase YedK